MKIYLLLTSCISPSHFKDKVLRNDSLQRESDYIQAIKKWNCYPSIQELELVFIDNSGFPLDKIKSELSNKLNPRVLSIIPEPIPDGFHYGYSELDIIHRFIFTYPNLNDDDYIIKITGRLFCRNLNSIISLLDGSIDWIGDVRSKRWNRSGYSYIPSQLFAFKVSYFKAHFFNCLNEMSLEKEVHLETYLYKKIFPQYLKSKHKIIMRLPFNLYFEGVGAHWNKSYQSAGQILISKLRSIFRILFPAIWI